MKDKILQTICEVYNKKYIGPLVVKKLNPIGYEVVLGLNLHERPIRIVAELDDGEFIKFFKEEIRNRHLNDIDYFIGYKVYQEYPDLESPSTKKQIEI